MCSSLILPFILFSFAAYTMDNGANPELPEYIQETPSPETMPTFLPQQEPAAPQESVLEWHQDQTETAQSI